MDQDTTDAAWHHADESWIRWSDEQLRAETARILSYWCETRWNPEAEQFEITDEGYGQDV